MLFRSRPEFKSYAAAVVENAKVLAATLKERGADLVSGGTDTHLALVDLTPLGVSSNLTFTGETDLVQAIRELTQQDVARAGDQLTSRNLQI